ncbi:MAG: DUF87 domain-containing protein, partial [Phycisphaerae bacterium]|nr:DUF87 domain-containing protein [Phycisphaerae bacterium]
PLELVTQTVAILAKRGVGKTYTATVMAEEMLAAGQQVVVIDPTGAWWGLRSSADGRGEGYPIVVLGGDHADIPLEEHAGELLAQAVVERRFSAILDLSLMRKGQVHRFMAPFAETLYRLNRQPVHLMIDEADAVAPQKCFGDDARTLGAMEDLVRRGRKRGIGCTLISQRPAVLNKNVLTQCEMLVAMRLVHPKDIDAVMEWVNVHAEPAPAEAMVAALPSLPVGTAYFWSPGWGDIFEKVQVRARRTFDSSATPRPGHKAAAPRKLAAVDVASLGRQITELAEHAKANDPAELKREVACLKRQLQLSAKGQAAAVQTGKRAPAPDAGEIARRVDRAVTERDRHWRRRFNRMGPAIAALAKDCRRVAEAAARFVQQIAQEALEPPPAVTLPPVRLLTRMSPLPTPRARPSLRTPVGADPAGLNSGDFQLDRAGRRVLAALAQHGSCSKRKVAILAGYAVNGGGFNNAIGRCRTNGWLEGSEPLAITEAGLAILGEVDPLPVGPELIDYWLHQLPKAEREILGVLVESPEALTKEQIAERTPSGYTAKGGGFNNAIGRLRTLQLIDGRKELSLVEELVG